jgi:uncharacterized protein (TIGR02679 family)
VLVNELAAPVLALGLPAEPNGSSGRLAQEARSSGEPIHLSLRMLLRDPPRWTARRVFVCENPTVVAVAADQLGATCAPLVCLEGMPAAAQQTLLAQLSGRGARLLYHGDFDWPGLRIGNFVMRRFGARPWRFGAGDYKADAGRWLEGPPVDAGWDAALRPTMAEAGRALDEESVVDVLLEDLATGYSTSR